MDILGIKYNNMTAADALARTLKLATAQEVSSVFFLNLDCLRLALSDKEYSGVLRAASIVLPDGIGLKLATRLFGGKMIDDCNGTDLSPLLMYYEDEDFCRRVNNLGFQVKFAPFITIVHAQGWKNSRFNKDIYRLKFESLKYYCSKYYKDRPIYYLFFRLFNFCSFHIENLYLNLLSLYAKSS
jgi:GT2 family glycosyltransferase